MKNKRASSEAAWALLTEGVTSARLEAHRLKHLINRAQKLVAASKYKEHLYQIAGDLIIALPERLGHLERDLDRTSLALAKMGETFLGARLPLSDKNMVEEAVEMAGWVQSPRAKGVAKRVAQRWVQARLGKTEQKILEMLQRNPRKQTAFNVGLMRKGNGRYTKLYPTNERLGEAALKLRNKGLVELDIIRERGDGEMFSVFVVRLIE